MRRPSPGRLALRRPLLATLTALAALGIHPAAHSALEARTEPGPTFPAQESALRVYAAVKAQALQWSQVCARHRHPALQAEALRLALRFGPAQKGADPELSRDLERLESSPPVPQAAETESNQELDAARQRVATAAGPLYALVEQALAAGRISLATEWAQDLLAADPGHRAACQALGYLQRGQAWVTPQAARLLDSGRRDDALFGWQKPEELAELRKGLRPLGGRFVPKPEADAAHRDPKNPYQIVTEHFTVYSCRPLEEAVRFARQAEALLASWRSHFAAFLIDPERGPALPSVALQPSLPMRIYYLNDQQQYAQISGVANGKGHYDLGRRCSFFFPYSGKDRILLGIFYHEVGHQLFQAYAPEVNQGLGFFQAMTGANYYLVEGLATFLEGLEDAGGKLLPAPLAGVSRGVTNFINSSSGITVVGAMRIRMAAQYVRNGTSEPLATLLALRRENFHLSPETRSGRLDRYSEAGGVVHFCMLGQGGRYRDAFARHVRKFYAGQALEAKALEEALQAPLTELDLQYQQYLRALPSGVP